jgi:hypothetical protein
LENAIWRRPLFSKFSKTHTNGLKHLFAKHFEIGARFSKRLKLAKSFEWDKTFQNSVFFESPFFLLQDNSLFRKALSFENF